MKRILVSLAVVLAAICSMSAQKGMSGIGGDINAMISWDDEDTPNAFGVNLKYQYNASNFYRIQPYVSVNMGDSKEGSVTEFEVGFDNHLFILSPRRIRPYLSAGIAFASIPPSYYYYFDDEREISVLFNTGVGLDIRCTNNISVQVEAGVSFPYYGPRLKVGVAYNF